MGRLKALRLGILKGIPHTSGQDQEVEVELSKPICPKEHDFDSLSRLLGKSKQWRMAKKVASMASNIIGQSTPEGLDDLLLTYAIKEHDKECVTGPENKWCRCEWCNARRNALRPQ